jgi:hypothetical protein
MTTPAQERFWSKVDKAGDCWLWTARVTDQGYGQFHYLGKTQKAHRVAYEWEHGPVELGLDHRHTCPKNCVRPAHLRPTTMKQNLENLALVRSNTTSGIRGVTWDKSRQLWMVQVMHHRKNHNGGRFADVEDAKAAAIALRLKLFTHNDCDREMAS